MSNLQCGIWILSATLTAAGWGQTAPPAATSQPTATAPSSTRAAAKRKHPAAPATVPAVQSIPMETAPPSAPPAPIPAAQQKADDRKLLQQQQQESAQAAQVTNQQVQQAQKQKDSIQNEVRIQDAPGPAQTGVFPAAGAPIAPVNSEQRIQDAPGPAQLPATQPVVQQPGATPPQ